MNRCSHLSAPLMRNRPLTVLHGAMRHSRKRACRAGALHDGSTIFPIGALVSNSLPQRVSVMLQAGNWRRWARFMLLTWPQGGARWLAKLQCIHGCVLVNASPGSAFYAASQGCPSASDSG